MVNYLVKRIEEEVRNTLNYLESDEASKKTCLWLKGLPQLKHTNEVGHGEYIITKKGNKVSK